MPGPATRAEDIRTWRQLGDCASILRALPGCEGPLRREAFDALRALEAPAAWSMVQIFNLARRAGQSEEQLLDQLWGRMVVAALLAGLRADEPRTRALSARALGELGALEALEPLLVQLERESTNLARLEMVRAEALLGQGPEATRIRSLYWARTSRWDQVLALGEAALPALLELVLTPSDDQGGHQKRAETVHRLAAFPVPAVLAALRSLLEEPNPTIRRQAAQELALLGDAAQDVPRFARLLAAREDDVRQAALDGLERLGGPQAVEVLRRYGDACTELGDQLAVGELLGRLGEVSLLARLLGEALPQSRLAAIQALARTGQRAAIEPLVGTLADAYPEVRFAARQALESLGWQPVVYRQQRERGGVQFWTVPADWGQTAEACGSQRELLLAALSAADPVRRRNAAEALGELGEAAAIAPLRACLGDPDLDVRVTVARALVALGEQPTVEAPWALHLALSGSANRCLELGPAGIEALLQAVGERPLQVRAAVAAALGQAGAVPAPEQQPRVLEALLRLLQDPAAPVRQAAALALSQQGGEAVVEPLLARLDDDEAAEAVVAALAGLGRLAVDGLLRTLGEGRPAVRRRSAQALGGVGDKQLVPQLRRGLDDPEAEVRLATVQALTRLGGKRPVKPLADTLTGDPAWTVRLAAARGLGELGDASVAGTLVAGLGDGYAEVRAACIVSLQQLGQPASAALLELAQALAGEQWEQVVALGQAGVEVLLRVLGETATDPRTVANRVGAALALGRIGDARALPALLAALDDAHPTVAAGAARGLGLLGEGQARPGLVTRLTHAHPGVRLAAVEALGQLGAEQALAALVAALSDADEAVRRGATAALGLAGEASYQQLVAGLRSPDAAVRQATAEALGRRGDRRAIDPLCEVLGDPARLVRLAAEQALTELGWRPVGWRHRRTDRGYALWTPRSFWAGPDDQQTDQLALLLRALADGDADRRRNAAEALGRLGDPGALTGLRGCFADPDPDVRLVAAAALVELGEQPRPEPAWAAYFVLRGDWEALVALGGAAAPHLDGVAGDEEPRRRLAAVRALARIGGRDAVAPLIRALGDAQETVRGAAAEALGRLRARDAVDALATLLADERGCPAEVGEALALLPPEAIGPLARLLAGDSPQVQARAALALGRCGHAGAVPPLLAALASPHPGTRAAAARALVELQRPDGIGPLGELRPADPAWSADEARAALIDALRRDPAGEVRATAAEALALAAGREPAVLDELRQGLADSHPQVRRACLAALTRLDQAPSAELLAIADALDREDWDACLAAGPAAIELLGRVLREPGSDPLTAARRAGAATTLGRLGHPAVVPALLDALTDQHPRVRAAVIGALGAAGTQPARQPLEALCGHADLLLRAAAVTALGQLGAVPSLAVLEQALTDDEESVRAAAYAALQTGGELVLERLLAGLRAPDESTRLQAATALGALGRPEAVDPLNGLLADPARPVGQAAQQALLRLGWRPVGWRSHRSDRGYAYWTRRAEWLGEDPGASQTALLLAALESDDPDRRRNAAEALGQTAGPEVAPALHRLLDDPVLDVRAVAAEALVILGETPTTEPAWAPWWLARQSWATLTQLGPAVVPLLASAVRQGPTAARLGALRTLATVGGAQAAAALVAALDADQPEVRQLAAALVGELRLSEAIPALLALLLDEGSADGATRALASFGAQAVAPLAAWFAGAHPDAGRRRALVALGGTGSGEALPALLAGLDERDPTLRRAAATALGGLDDARATAALSARLRGDGEARVRTAAAQALGRLGSAEALPELRAGLADGYAEVAHACAEALTALGQPVEPALSQIAAAIAAERWEEAAAGGARGLDLLLRVLAEQDLDPLTVSRRAGAARALGLLGDLRALGPLQAALAAPSARIQLEAIRALGRLGQGAVCDSIARHLGASYAPLRAAAIEALAALGPRPYLAQLEAALGDPDEAVRRAATRALGGCGEQVLNVLLGMLNAADDGLRLEAARALGELGLEAALEPLHGLLADPQAGVRQAAEQSLVRLGWHAVGWRGRRTDRNYQRWTSREEWLQDDPQASQAALLLAALEHEDPDRRRNAAEALGSCGVTAAVPRLHEALRHDPDRDVRIVAAEALELLGETPAPTAEWIPYWVAWEHWDSCVALGEAAVDELRLVLTTGEERGRPGALRALARIAGPAAAAGLLQATHDPQPRLRLAALTALGQRPATELAAAVPRLVELLDDEQAGDAAAALLVGPLASDARGALLARLEGGSVAGRRRAAALLGASQDATVVPALRSALADPAGEVARAAAQALGRVGGEQALAVLAGLLRDDGPAELRVAAAEALGTLGSAAAGEPLRTGLTDPATEVRQACRNALTALELPADEALLAASEALAREQWAKLVTVGAPAVPLLLNVLARQESDPATLRERCHAARTLGEIGDRRALPALLPLLRLGEPRLQAAAAQALGGLGDGRATPFLVELFDRSGDELLRLTALRSLATLGDEAGRDVLARALRDEAAGVRSAAAVALGEAGPSQAERLIEALFSTDGELRRNAALQLARLGDARAIDPLNQLLADPWPPVRAAARQALLALGWHPVGWRARPDDRGYTYWTSRAEWLGADPSGDQLTLLCAGLDEADPDRRRNAAEALGQVGDPAAQEALAARLAIEWDARVGEVLRESLAALQEAELQTAQTAGQPAAAADEGPTGQRRRALRQASRQSPATVLEPLGQALDDAVLGPLAARRLAELGDAGRERLLAALGSASPRARRWALDGLATAAAPECAAAALDLLQHGDPPSRMAAAAVLADVAAAETPPALARALAQDADERVRAAAAAGLGRRPDEATAGALRLGLVDPSAQVRAVCADALRALGEPLPPGWAEVAAALARGDAAGCAAACAGATDWPQRALAVGGAGRRATAARALALLGARQAAPALLAALQEPDDELAAAAALASGALRLAEARPALIRLLTDGSGARRAAAAEALGRIGALADLPALEELLSGGEPALAAAVLRGLAGMGPAGAAPALAALQRPGDPAVRLQAATLLGEVGDVGAVEALVAAAAQDDPALRAAATASLAQLGWGPDSPRWRAQALLPRLSSPEPEERRRAATELGEIAPGLTGYEAAQRPLLELLEHDAQAEIRAAAGKALVLLGVEPGRSAGWVPYWVACDDWTVLATLGEPVRPALAEVLRDRRKDRRRGAVEVLGGLAGVQSVELLRPMLDDPEPEVRRATARALDRVDGMLALPELLARLGDADSQPEVARTLAAQGAATQPALEQALRSGTVAERCWAARALGESRRVAEVLPTLLQAASEADPAAVRAAACDGLGRLGDAEAVAPLLAALHGDAAAEVRRDAAEALGKLGDLRAAPTLRLHLTEGYVEVRQACLSALAALGAVPDEQTLALVAAIGRGRWPEVVTHGAAALELLLGTLDAPELDPDLAQARAGAAACLGELGDRRAVQPLVVALADPQPKVRAAAARSLGRLGDRAVEPSLLQGYASVQPEVRIACLEALRQLGGPLGAGLLCAALDDPASEVRHAALSLLGQHYLPAAYPRLLARVVDGDSETRLRAMAALVQLGRPEAIEPLAASLDDPDPAIRSAAWEGQLALGWHPVGWRGQRQDPAPSRWTGRREWLAGDDGADQRSLLLAALASAVDPERRRVAAEVLGQLGGPTVIAGLRAALEQDADLDVRVVAGESLEELGDSPTTTWPWLPLWIARGRWPECAACGPPAVPMLRAVLDEPDEVRRRGALAALADIPGEEATAALRQASCDPAPALRVAAAQALVARDDRASLPRLYELLDDPAVAPTVVALLERSPALVVEAGPQLLELLRSGQPGQRRWAARLLGPAPGEQTEAALLAAVDDPQAPVQLAALEALGRPGRAARVIDELLERVRRDFDPSRREAAAAALGRCGEARAVPLLVGGLGDPWGEVRRACQDALRALGAPASPAQLEASAALAGEQWQRLQGLGRVAVPLLAHHVLDTADDPAAAQTRARATRLLGELGDPQATPALQQLLDSPHGIVRAAALRSLGQLGETSVEPRLRLTLATPTAPAALRLAALEGLVALVGPLADQALAAACEDADEALREPARVLRNALHPPAPPAPLPASAAATPDAGADAAPTTPIDEAPVAEAPPAPPPTAAPAATLGEQLGRIQAQALALAGAGEPESPPG